MKIRIVPFVFLMAFGFAILHNWPVLLHFANILLGLDHFKIGFAISIPIVLVAALNFVLLPYKDFDKIFEAWTII